MGSSTQQEIRGEIREERARLADDVQTLRGELSAATDVGGRLRAKLPLAAAGALGLGFVASGGIGATARLLFRRGREAQQPAAQAGRFTLLKRN